MNNDLWLWDVLYNLHICQLNAVHLGELEQKSPDLSPQAKDFQPGNVPLWRFLSPTSVYLCLPFWLQLTFIHSSPPHLSYLISLHPCPDLVFIFTWVLPCPTKGMHLSFYEACGFFWFFDLQILLMCWKLHFLNKWVSLLLHGKSI